MSRKTLRPAETGRSATMEGLAPRDDASYQHTAMPRSSSKRLVGSTLRGRDLQAEILGVLEEVCAELGRGQKSRTAKAGYRAVGRMLRRERRRLAG